MQRVPAWIEPAYETSEEHASTVALHAFFDLLQIIPLKADGEDMPENADFLERLRRGVPLVTNSKKRRGRKKGRLDIERIPERFYSDACFLKPAEGNETTIHTGLKGQRYGLQQSSHFLDDVMYDELCKVMCYADLMADKDSLETGNESSAHQSGDFPLRTPAIRRCLSLCKSTLPGAESR